MNKTEVLNVFETFAGIGAQHKAISNIDKEHDYFKVVGTSEWDVRAIVAYAQIHHQNKYKVALKKVEKWTDQKVDEYFANKTFSLNSKTPSKITRKNRLFKNAVIAANIVNNNSPDITKLKGKILKDVDLLTYSFPCQGLSIANMGRDKGIKENAKSTSNLIWQILRILNEAKESKIQLPKYLLMENVKNLIGKKHKKDYDRWIEVLKTFGYHTYTFVLNGFKHSSLQRRERVFAISILGHKKKWTNEKLNNLIDKEYGKELDIDKRKEMYTKILKSSDGFKDEINDATPNDTPSRHRMKDNPNLKDRNWRKGFEYTFNTLTTKQDRHPNIGMIPLPKKMIFKGKLDYRFITNREAYQIMGFESADYSKVKPLYKNDVITKASLYRQAGNSIVVSVLESIFSFIKNFERGDYV